MTSSTMRCDCCGGDMPCQAVWDFCRDSAGECDGSVSGSGRCRAFDADAWRLNDMAVMLDRHGDRFTGTSSAEMAGEWIDHDFTAGQADGWCEVGCWDAATAAALRDAGLTPEMASDASERLVEGLDDPAEEYTAGDPIYAACNCDIGIDVIIRAAN